MTREIRVIAPSEEAARRLAETVWHARAVSVVAIGPATQADFIDMWQTMPLHHKGTERRTRPRMAGKAAV